VIDYYMFDGCKLMKILMRLLWILRESAKARKQKKHEKKKI